MVLLFWVIGNNNEGQFEIEIGVLNRRSRGAMLPGPLQQKELLCLCTILYCATLPYFLHIRMINDYQGSSFHERLFMIYEKSFESNLLFPFV